MQFEDFDKRIKEAADHHHPAYDEQAWAKMEKLLNKHMPVKKDRRRGVIFFLLFLGLLTGGSAIYYFNTTGDKKIAGFEKSTSSKATADENGGIVRSEGTQNPTPDTQNFATADATAEDVSNQQPTSPKATVGESNTNDRNTTDRPVIADPAVTGKVNPSLLKNSYTKTLQDAFNENLKQQRRNTIARKQGTQKGVGVLQSDLSAGNQNGQINSGSSQLSGELSQMNDAGNRPVSLQRIGLDEALKLSDAQIIRKMYSQPGQEVKVPQLNITQPSVAGAKKPAAKARSTFFIAASGGPDVSVVGVSNTGTVKLVGGAGLGYTFKGKFTLRTGFYTARKIYTASPDQYHPPSSFWNYYPNLQKVEADCKVYEIPLLFTYNFAKKGNGNWFAGTGISSYLMKRETYNYFYKNTAGVNTSRKYTLFDKNHHYFSVLTLSVGYQRSLSKSLFVAAEPYFKVPLSGIGYGKINLNSAGLMLHAGWVPFHAKKATAKSH